MSPSLSVAQTSKDLVDFLLRNQTFFSHLSVEDKVAMKALRPKPNLPLQKQDDDGRIMHFKTQWYDKCDWLTGSSTREKMYCFYCILFSYRNYGEWSKTGLGADCLKNIGTRIKNHECSSHHIYAAIKFKGLGKVRPNRTISEPERLAIMKHNEIVDLNRLVIKRLLSASTYLARQWLPVNGSNYADLLDLLAEEEPHIKNHLINSTIFQTQRSLLDIQKKMIRYATEVVREEILNELKNCHFVSIRIDSMTDVWTEKKVSLVLRYASMTTGNVEERFVGFYPLHENTPEYLTKLVLKVLNAYQIPTYKLAGISYDGAVSTLGENPNTVYKLIKKHYHYALFSHSNIHQLYVVLIHACKSIPQVKPFIANLIAFDEFFCHSNRINLLREMHKLPQPVEMCWHAEHELTFICSILAYFRNLKAALQDILDKDGWDYESVNLARGLKGSLEDPEFVFLLLLFSKLYRATTPLHDISPDKCLDVKTLEEELQKCLSSLRELRGSETTRECIEEVKKLMTVVDTVNEVKIELKTEEMHVEYDEYGQTFGPASTFDPKAFAVLTFRIVDTVIENLKSRFQDICTMSFLDMINEKKFVMQNNPSIFSNALMGNLSGFFPFFDEVKLKGELMFIYGCEDKHLPPKDLFEYVISNDLKDVLPETGKLLSLVLCFPVMTACDKNRDMLKRIKSFARKNMADEGLTDLATLAIEKEFVKTYSSKEEFVKKVIELFSARDGRIELIYKQI